MHSIVKGDSLKDKMGKVCSLHGGNKKCTQDFGWIISWRPRLGWICNIKMALKGMGC